jgi:hypothetical protein
MRDAAWGVNFAGSDPRTDAAFRTPGDACAGWSDNKIVLILG